MGWDFCETWRSKKDVMAEQTRAGRFGPGSKPLAVKPAKAGYWILWDDGQGKKFIECGLVRKDLNGWYGVKYMDAGMHPYYYDCPVEWLTPDVPFDPKWAEQVRRHANRRSRPPARHDRRVRTRHPLVGGCHCCPNHPDRQSAGPSTNLCGECLLGHR